MVPGIHEALEIITNNLKGTELLNCVCHRRLNDTTPSLTRDRQNKVKLIARSLENLFLKSFQFLISILIASKLIFNA